MIRILLLFTAFPTEDRAGNCVYTYKDMVKRAEDKMPSEDYKYLSKYIILCQFNLLVFCPTDRYTAVLKQPMNIM